MTDQARQPRASLAELLELAPIGAMVRSFDSDQIVYWSRGAEDIYGWRSREAIGQVSHTLLRTVFPISKEAVDEELSRHGQWAGELIHIHRDGQRIVAASRQVIQRGERGQPLAILELNTDITPRKALEEGLRESEERFRLLVETVQDYAIFLLSPVGEVLTWNAGAQRLKGYASEEIVGQHFSRFYTPEAIAEGLPRTMLARAESEGRAEHEGWRVRKDGSLFWANVVITALRDGQGNLRGFAKVTRDLTERKQAEEARARAIRGEAAQAAAEAAQNSIRASRDQLAAILAGVAEGVTAMDTSGHLLFANHEAARLSGYPSAEELVAAPPGAVVSNFELLDEQGARLPPESLPTRSVLAGGGTAERLIRFRSRQTGQERWTLLNATAITDEHARVAMVVSIFRDVTDSKLAENTSRFLAAINLELSRSLDYAQTLQRLAELSVPALADWCVVDITEDGRPRRIAQASAHGEPADLPDPAQGLRLTASRYEPHTLSVPLQARGELIGVITLLMTTSGRQFGPRDLVLAEDVAVRAALALDNARLYRESREQTDVHMELNAALRETMAQLQEALATRDEFLASVSHDLKNPIASIKGMTQLLERRLSRTGSIAPEQLAETLSHIDSVATRAAAQVEELLDVARMRLDRPLDLDLEPVDLVELARSVVAEQQSSRERNEISFDASIPSLVGNWDGRLLGRALSNLLDNATKYSPDGGPILVRVSRDDGWGVVSVEDHGVGIPAEDLHRVFQRFQRGANVVGQVSGTGIGLASAQHIVQSHNGTIEATSEVGQGTIMTIRLPIGEAAA